MLKKMPSHCGDDTCSSCVVAGDFIFLAHHGGGQEVNDIVHQVKATIESMRHTLSTVDATEEGRHLYRKYGFVAMLDEMVLPVQDC